ncbi:GNAT family N-acetyltransferase [Chelatococcus reniformis]|uniref:N-acetyltransferase n=1 Tax=Chelatococcus reniformis TaxID=1494448 RepID=A0A916XE15_9HYPH|nr:GNAT family protein [Chelatococcus reniformis]GGC63658.1 N-acetyltransferase [Chelatococcus reniformis]
MTDLTAWQPPPFPSRRVLEGRYCRLEPLDVARHADELWAALVDAPEVWAYLPLTAPDGIDGYRSLLASMVERTDIVPLAVIDAFDGRAKGHLWLMEVRPSHGVAEVGFITYSPRLQRTRTATEAIYLCGAFLFGLGYRRFEWKCNDLNAPSKRAAARFGFVYEGLFRQHMVVKGANRDTAWFSIVDGEWPAVDAAFRAWLAPDNFDAEGRQRRGLAEVRAELTTTTAG